MEHRVAQLLGREPLMATLIIIQPFLSTIMGPQGQKSQTNLSRLLNREWHFLHESVRVQGVARCFRPMVSVRGTLPHWGAPVGQGDVKVNGGVEVLSSLHPVLLLADPGFEAPATDFLWVLTEMAGNRIGYMTGAFWKALGSNRIVLCAQQLQSHSASCTNKTCG